jgi:Ni2+-binding GTPase involved in maturation of urease and hydrogenase
MKQQSIRFIMIGGFLGAGKTTTLARLAAHYTQQGKRVGLVTNDQAQNLVDTNSLRSQGFTVEEVPGACFCCKFDELVSKIGDLSQAERPEIILAEPVGSCTDLVATVVQPMKDLHATEIRVAPYTVLFKPSHGLRILRNESSGFSPKAAYIFRKQLEEADAIVVNRLDELDSEKRAELKRLLQEQYPETPVLFVSARTGDGFPALLELLSLDGGYGQKILDIDYDIYAEGEAELGWLNSSVELQSPRAFELDPLLLEIISGLKSDLKQANGEVAHLKVIGIEEGIFGVANLVSNESGVELSLASNASISHADLIVNARVAVDPNWLQSQVEQRVQQACASRGITASYRQTQSLRPGRPTPTHRYASKGS